MTEDKPAGRIYFRKALLWAILAGLGIFLPYYAILFLKDRTFNPFSGETPSWLYNGSILLLLPLAQGFAAALGLGRDKVRGGEGFGLIFCVLIVDCLIAVLPLREGVICLIMASPLLLGLIAFGYVVGRIVARRGKSRSASVSLAPLALVLVIGETLGPVPDVAREVSSSVMIDAPADVVWRYVVSYPEITETPDYWVWQMGLPSPTHSVAEAPAVGARRQCRFTGGHAFDERITVLEPNRRLVFAVTGQMQHPEIFGHLTFDEGEVVLTPLSDGRTKLTMTGRYRLNVRPAAYFAGWAEDVTRQIHRRTMAQMKQLAEADT
ncbi:activator of Hsp90 ATPase 1-like family protein [Asticcacaulis biprosthecium C19]|uniref:Activator of Hsp90 ATPase 1-like family protein n=1 Tax=Asticcacaulis biprosthecium C19 TaxID=715226 RepID=F4QL35_9CAUL|nr:SRPBCC family protein [Asticcacaulis biprosthecium]EGF93410.1 activator of Hsp90 ATPase 1-like family protein [Asticcacaulis biprosthecium C19]